MPSLFETPRWKKTDESDRLDYCQNHEQLYLFYGRIYTPRKGYKHSKTNQLVLNLKKKPTSSNERELYWKSKAINQFASEVIDFLSPNLPPNKPRALIPMPPSKTRQHPDYDDRMEQVAQLVVQRLVVQRFSNLRYWPLLKSIKDVEGSHTGNISRNPEELFKTIDVEKREVGNYLNEEIVYVIDDVLTSGSHFMAARQHILKYFPNIQISGLFWAKTQSIEDFDF